MYKILLPTCYMFKKRISYLAFSAVALCVFIVVVVMTVMSGLVNDFKKKNHDFTGDCVVGTESLVGFAYYEDFVKILEQADFVESVSPVIKSYALVSPRGSRLSRGVEIMGIEPVRHSGTTNFGKTLHYHKDDVSRAFEPAYDTNLSGCVLGIDLELVRGVRGEYAYRKAVEKHAFSISCFPLTAKGALAKAGTSLVNTKTFHYSDTSRTGLARADGSLIYLPFEKARQLCGMDGPLKRANAVHVKFRQNVDVKAGIREVTSLWRMFVKEKTGAKQAELLNTVSVKSWTDYRRPFIAAMEKEQTMLTIMFALVGITTVFIILVVFYMLVSHKSKDIGVLKSIGVSNGNIMGLFCGFALLLALLSSGVGAAGGWLFLLKINDIETWLFEHFKFQLWDRSIFAIGEIPSSINLKVLGIIVLSAIVACLVGALVPSWQAARLEPAETLQVNQL